MAWPRVPEALADRALVAAIALVAFAHVPDLPRGMIAADLLIAVAVPFVLASRPRVPAGLLASCALFAAAATASALANGGSYVKLLGHWELALLAIATAGVAARQPDAVERALVWAAGIAAVSATVGALLWAVGIDTSLLNPTSGDLAAGNYPRLRGVTERANQLATVVATGSLLLFARPELIDRRWLRRGLWGCFAVAMTFTFSRSVPFWLLGIAGLAAWQRGKPRLAIATGAAAAIGLAGLWLSVRYGVHAAPDRLWDSTIAWNEPGTRWLNALGAWETAVDQPWLGIGPGRTPSGVWSAHLTWLNLWAVLGPAALLAFAALFAGATASAWRAAAAGLVVVLTLFAIDSLHRDIEDMRHLWVTLGLAWAAGTRHVRAPIP